MLSQSLPPSSPTSRPAEQPSQPETYISGPISVRIAETDDDAINIHRFLLMVAQPAMRGGVDAKKSLIEVIRVIKYEAAWMAIRGDFLVGTLGLIKGTWWYNDVDFLADRWNFVLPQERNRPDGAYEALWAEAEAVAKDAGLELIDQGKIRERRNKLLLMPRVILPESANIPPPIGSA